MPRFTSANLAQDSVDIARNPSVSFARAIANDHDPSGFGTGTKGDPGGMAQEGSPTSGRAGLTPKQAPLQIAKVQVPALRGETLSRPRLVEWLASKVTKRAVLVTADAGYGKSTLLADFARHTQLPVLWYRLDRDDRDWATFLAYLITAGQEHHPDFAERTSELLRPERLSTTTRDAAFRALAEDLGAFTESGAVLVLDDFHEVDDAPDVRWICRSLIELGLDRFCVLISSRRPPELHLTGLRASGEVPELRTDDMRFDVDETGQLFNGTYGRALDGDVIETLTTKTEGWVASLQMVQAALRNRSAPEIRRFVRELSGASHDLYEYLAEEVVSELPNDLRNFLMHTSVLEVVTVGLACAATELDEITATRLMVAAERLTLLGRAAGGSAPGRRYHPLVREFLTSRLCATEGLGYTSQLHRRVALAVVGTDWRLAAHHFREAGDIDSMIAVVGDAIPSILGDGQYAAAETLIGGVAPSIRPRRFDLISSRVDMQLGDYEAAIAVSEAFLERAETNVERDHALLNLVTLFLNFGDGQRAVEYAAQLRASADSNLAAIASASMAMVTGSESDDIDRINRLLMSMARRQRGTRPHHFGVTQYNLASSLVLQDRPNDAIAALDPAIEAFESGSAAMELAAARVTQAQALAMAGRVDEARAAIGKIIANGDAHREGEVGIGIADILDSYVDPDSAWSAMAEFDLARSNTPSEQRLLTLALARFHVRRGQLDEASAALSCYPEGRPVHLGIDSARRFTLAYLANAIGSPDAAALATQAMQHARLQGAHRWRRASELLVAIADKEQFSRRVVELATESPHTLTYLADIVCRHLVRLDEMAIAAVERVAMIHPSRWRHCARRVIDSRSESAIQAGHILENVGDRHDIRRLRALSHDMKRTTGAARLGKALIRRVANRVYVEDQGRIRFVVGDRVVLGSSVRRKVLGLACFLLSRPGMACTRDQALEAMWPDLAPEVAVNSLNQTLYFLRRIFEPDYLDDLTPGYVHHDSDVIWFDQELITSRSNECKNLLRGLSVPPAPNEVEHLVALYQGRFALDFEYEDWAADHRDLLHAGYLEVVEHSVMADIGTGHHGRAIRNARRALEVDPSAESVQVALLRLCQMTGASSAAAERYAHYAGMMRDDLGIDPVPLESL